MKNLDTCPRCGAAIPRNAPGGACPACLLNQGLSATGDASAPLDPPSLETLRERFPQFEIVERLGRGGMGEVYKARQTHLNRHVALKILPLDPERHPEFRERFLREAQALARLSHPHIVTLHDFGESGGLVYFIMEYLEGHDLKQRLARGPLPPREALEIARNVCDALQYAHGAGVIHRDIKPANLLLDKAGRVKIADFGLARLLAPDSPDPALTLSGASLGTPDYMAPEQRIPGGQVDDRADLYAVGVVLYQMLTGELPLGSFEPPSRRSRVTPRADAIVFRALRADPAQRYPNAASLKADLDRLLAAGPVARPARPGWARLALAVALLAAGAAVGGWHFTRRVRPALPQDVVPFGGNYYKVYYENLGWHDARRRCERVGGHLAIVGSRAEDEFLAAISRSHVWLGATDEAREGEWIWVDGTPLAYSNWDQGEPNNAPTPRTWNVTGAAAKPRPGEHCLMMSKYGRWNDLDADSSIVNGFICEWEGTRYPAPRRIVATADDLHAALRQANPDYNGKGVFRVQDGAIREAVLLHAGVTNLAPLAGLPLASLALRWTEASDLAPLAGMPLARLDVSWSRVEDLSPLAGMPLAELRLDGCKVRDLTPLRGMPLDYLDISHTRVTDLAPLAGMPLRELHMNCVKVTDLSPLAGMPLKKLGLLDVPAADLAVLASCTNLESLVAPPHGRNIERLRDLPRLERLNNQPPAEFWQARQRQP